MDALRRAGWRSWSLGFGGGVASRVLRRLWWSLAVSSEAGVEGRVQSGRVETGLETLPSELLY